MAIEIPITDTEVITVNDAVDGGCSLHSTLGRAVCKVCGEEDCMNHSHEMSDGMVSRFQYNGALEAIESLILACASEGIDVDDEKFKNAVQTAIVSCANHF